MIDNFSILLSHGLLLITFWILIRRDDTDVEEPPVPDSEPEGFAHGRVKSGRVNRPKPQNPFKRKPAVPPNKKGGAGDA
ncbi:hypothetical protein ACFOWX_12280 [Sphingorhabdus arenilitoris]|uniref:Uncharacterized protein n=1 Tax=Sphingorhabdus arenilitoris TaxID=1490041 RepID=A0ABV8RIG1_9SPHN